VCNTLENGLNWVLRAFIELILLATSISLSRSTLVPSIFWSSREVPLIFASLGANPRVVRSGTSPCSA
jgi:hypothetical protein